MNRCEVFRPSICVLNIVSTRLVKYFVLYIFFWVFPRRQNVVGRRFGTLCQFHLQRLDVDCEV